MVFVYKCLEVADFFVMFSCWDFIQPMRYGVCNMHVGCGGWFVVGGSFDASSYVISLPKIPMSALIICIVMLRLVHRIWWTMAEISSLSGGCVGMRGGRCDC